MALSEEDKRRIDAEESYRAQVRGRLPAQQVTSFTDKANKFMFYYIGLPIIAIMAMLFVIYWVFRLFSR